MTNSGECYLLTPEEKSKLKQHKDAMVCSICGDFAGIASYFLNPNIPEKEKNKADHVKRAVCPSCYDVEVNRG